MNTEIKPKMNMGTLFVALAAISWSGSGVLGKYTTWSSLSTAGARSLIACIILASLRGGVRVKLTKGNLLGAFGAAATSVLFMMANKLTTAANAIVLQYAMPAVVILLNWLINRRKPFRRDIITCVFVLAGVIMCSADSMGGGSITGDILALLSAITYAFVFYCSRMKGANAQDYTFLGQVFTVPLIIYAFFDKGATFTTGNILAQVGMGFCLAGGYFFISMGMKTISPISAAITSNIEPVLNPLWVFLFLGEKPGWIALVGAAVVLGAVTIYSLPARITHSRRLTKT